MPRSENWTYCGAVKSVVQFLLRGMIIDGRKIADEILSELMKEVKILRQTKGRPPKLAAVLVGDIKGSRKFLELKKKAAEKVGVECRVYEFPPDITTAKLQEELAAITEDPANQGVMIELPLPPQLDVRLMLNTIPQEKDVDVLSEMSQGSFFSGNSAILPPAVEAVKIIFEKNNIDPKGKKCAVFGQGLLVGRPVSRWLALQGADVSALDEFTENPETFSKNADVIVSGVGKPNTVKSDMVKEGVIVIDFGYEHVGGKSVGDVAFEEVNKKASLITPVPGGVGPLVIAAVLKNLITLVKLKND